MGTRTPSCRVFDTNGENKHSMSACVKTLQVAIVDTTVAIVI